MAAAASRAGGFKSAGALLLFAGALMTIMGIAAAANESAAVVVDVSGRTDIPGTRDVTQYVLLAAGGVALAVVGAMLLFWGVVSGGEREMREPSGGSQPDRAARRPPQ